jgi:hypothetical protein
MRPLGANVGATPVNDFLRQADRSTKTQETSNPGVA